MKERKHPKGIEQAKTLVVTTQAELNAISPSADVKIEIRSACQEIVIVQQYANVVRVFDSTIYAKGNSTVFAYGSTVFALDYSEVSAYNNSSVFANGRCQINANDGSTVSAVGKAEIFANGNSRVEASEDSKVLAFDNSNIIARGRSEVSSHDFSKVRAYENSKVTVLGGCMIEAHGNAQVLLYDDSAKISTEGSARVVHMPRNMAEYADFYGIRIEDEQAILYKAVQRNGEQYFAEDNPETAYLIGQVFCHDCDPNIKKDSSYGIQVSHLPWALRSARQYANPAILECSVPISDIIVPRSLTGELRTSRMMVLREIPLAECGAMGKVLVGQCR